MTASESTVESPPAARQPEQAITEYCSAHAPGARVDRAAGVIRGVKILGLTSRNGRRYLPEALRSAVALYEGAKVNLNHPRGGPLSPRDYQDRIGMIRQVEAREGEGLFADFHFNPKHALAEQLAWDAEHAPHNVGFSHNVTARLGRRDGQTIVEAISRVRSVDLVADPGTTEGLFEQHSQPNLASPAGDDPAESQASNGNASDSAEGASSVALAAQLAEQLSAMRDEVRQLREQLAESRRDGSASPQSREQTLVEGLFRPHDVQSFVRAIT